MEIEKKKKTAREITLTGICYDNYFLLDNNKILIAIAQKISRYFFIDNYTLQQFELSFMKNIPTKIIMKRRIKLNEAQLFRGYWYIRDYFFKESTTLDFDLLLDNNNM